MAKKNPPIETLSYEEAFTELEVIISRLENETPSLQDSMQLFERGQILSAHCAALLENAQLKVKQLSGLHTADETTSNKETSAE